MKPRRMTAATQKLPVGGALPPKLPPQGITPPPPMGAMKRGGKVRKMAKGGRCKGMGAAVRGGKFKVK